MTLITYVLADAYAGGIQGATVEYAGGLSFDIAAALSAGGGSFVVDDSTSNGAHLRDVLDHDPVVKRSGTQSGATPVSTRPIGPVVAYAPPSGGGVLQTSGPGQIPDWSGPDLATATKDQVLTGHSLTVEASTDAITARAGRVSGYPFKVQDKVAGRTGGAPDNQNIVSAYNISVSPNGFAGSIKFHGTNGNPTSDYGAWSLGLDVTSPAVPDRDFYIGKLNTDGTTSDIIYLGHGGASAATVMMFPAGGSHPVNGGVNIWGRTRSASDSPLLALMPTSDIIGKVFVISKLDDTQPVFSVAVDGSIVWGAGAAAVPNTSMGRTSDGALWTQSSQTGAGVQRIFFLNQAHTPKADGDTVRIEFGADGYSTAQIDAIYNASAPGGALVLRNKNAGGTMTERLRMDTTNIAFNGATPQARPALPVAAVDAATTQALANAIRTALINYGLTT